MVQLFERELVYIAQPPLYEIRAKGSKKSEYILNEAQMRKRMTERGLDGTTLTVRDNTPAPCEIKGKELSRLVKMLSDIEWAMSVLARRGINFHEMAAQQYDAEKLPIYHIRAEGQSEFYNKQSEYESRMAQLKSIADTQSEGGDSDAESFAGEELHEVARVNEIDTKLKSEYKLDLRDFLLKPQRSVSGEALPTKFLLASADENYEVVSLGDICSAIRQIGGKSIEIKRFKGLGEMNAEQLWETTMDPARRTLVKVKVEDAGEADRLFSILMGDDVVKRRNFIREHALEVQNLDV
jgi:DNA gyrase subunit B